MVDTLGFDACIDHKFDVVPSKLKAAVADGIEIYFENVRGAVSDAAILLFSPKALIPVYGMISQKNATALREGPDRMYLLLGTILRKRMTLRSFIIFDDFGHLFPVCAKEMGEWVRTGSIP